LASRTQVLNPLEIHIDAFARCVPDAVNYQHGAFKLEFVKMRDGALRDRVDAFWRTDGVYEPVGDKRSYEVLGAGEV
jgi:hypothetical protein